MKIKKSNNSNKSYRKLLILIGALFIACIAAGVVWYINQPQVDSQNIPPRKENSVNYSKATKEEKEAGLRAKQDFAKRSENKSTEADSSSVPTSPSPVESQKDTQSAVPVTITSAAIQESVLQVRAIVTLNSSEGECHMKMSKSGQNTIVRRAEVAAMNSYFICKGFDVDTVSLAKGDWQVEISYNGPGGFGKASKTVSL